MATQEKVMSLNACAYKDLPSNSKVFNSMTIEYYMWVYLNPEDVRGCNFLRAEEITLGADHQGFYPDTFSRESQCWIRVATKFIDTSIGNHVIRLYFVECATGTEFSLYVSYYIQNDDPEKPYVYMKKPEEDT